MITKADMPARSHARESKSQFVSRGKKRKYLKRYCECGRHDWSAKAAGVVTRTHYDWLRDDPIYVNDFEFAKEVAIGALESHIVDRGFHADRPSDLLAIFHMKKLDPSYRDNYSIDVKHTHTIDAKEATQEIGALLERNPELVGVMRGMLEGDDQDIIDAEVTQEGVGPPNEGGAP